MREKPPVLSRKELEPIAEGLRWNPLPIEELMQAQRDADLKWLREEIEKKPNRYLITGTSGQGQPIYFTGPHTDAQIEAYETCRQDVLSLLENQKSTP